MNTINKIKDIEHDMCKSHSARTEKDQYRICPSKLTKKELEDIYYSLIDNNLQLKKTINAQQDQIKILSTRIYRITTQKSIYGSQKCCCKVVANEHKDIITDLKQANEKLVDKVRLLNMRLCSAKQFVKRSPLQTSRCQNCINIRNSSSALNVKKSQTNLRMKSTSSQYLDQDITPLIFEETKDSTPDRDECTQNKCKTTIEELNEEIANLQKELLKAQEDYTHKLTKVEQEVSDLKEENLRVRTQARLSDDNLQLHKKDYQELLKKLRNLEAQSDAVSLELTVEKQKVRELETQLRAAEISQTVVETLRSHAGNHTAVSGGSQEASEVIVSACKVELSDDSGYLESVQRSTEDKTNNKSNISDQIEDLQTQLDAMKNLMVYGGGDNQLYGIDEQITIEPDGDKESGNDKTKNNNYKTKKRKEKNKKSKRNSIDVSFDEVEETGASSKDMSEHYGLDTNYEGLDNKEITEKEIDIKEDSRRDTEGNIELKKVYKDIGVQSIEEKNCVSRGVGDDLVEDTTDAAVQIGDSLGAINDIDTKTYSRRSAKSRTYSVGAKPKRPTRDNTECEISSLSDLPTERESNPSDYISPGEERVSSSLSEAYGTSCCTSSCGTSEELSDGELLLSRHEKSYGEVELKGNTGEEIRPVSPSIRMEQAIRSVKEELTRCTQLLEGGPLDPSAFPFDVNPFVLFRSRDGYFPVYHTCSGPRAHTFVKQLLSPQPCLSNIPHARALYK